MAAVAKDLRETLHLLAIAVAGINGAIGQLQVAAEQLDEDLAGLRTILDRLDGDETRNAERSA